MEQEQDAPPVAADVVPRRGDHVAFVELDGEIVAYDEEQGSLHLLDEIATIIFGCCDGTGTVAEIVDDLTEAFGAERARVDADVRALLGQLTAEGLVVDARAAGAP
jgi:PqqD family protein of HPr-rel-A system